MILAPLVKWREFDNTGKPLSGGQLFTYVAGTSTPQATYTDYTGGTPNANPIILDSNGRANVWLDPTLSYKFVLQDSANNTLYTQDNVSGSAATGIGIWNANVTYGLGSIVADASNQGILYVSLAANNQGNTLTTVSKWALYPGGIQRAALTANTTLAVSDHGGLIRSNSTAGSLTHTLPACSTSPIGLTITVKDIGTGGNTTSVKGSGADNIDGNNTYANVLHQYDSVDFRNNGASWDVR